MRKLLRFSLFIWIAYGVCACSLAPAFAPTFTLVPTLVLVVEPTGTAPPAATATADATLPSTAEPSRTVRPTRTETPTRTSTVTPGPSPTKTRTPTPTRFPTRTRTITPTPAPNQPNMYIMRPGLLSRVVSPIQMEIYAVTGAGGNVLIDLVGEDGRVISRQLLQQGNDAGRRYWLAPVIPFEIDAAAETARLQVSSLDEDGRVTALASVDLVLLAVGRNEINPAVINLEPYIIRTPDDEQVIGGGVVRLEALVRPVNESPLIVELVNPIGTVLAVQRYDVPPPGETQTHSLIQLDIPYSVRSETPVRLIMRQEGSRIPGSVALKSIPLILVP